MSAWKPVPGHIMTRWAEDITPENVWMEYPRPQMVRKKWQNLNGLWDYAITPRNRVLSKNAVSDWESDGEILVPFAIEISLERGKATFTAR